MTFPNPAGYYLPMPEQFEAEIVSFPFSTLSDFNSDLASFLSRDYDAKFLAGYTSEDLDDWVNNLEPDELINLIRWVAERLAHLYHI